nr:MAG: putative terminase small subunit [Bacteriophage sp.]
MKLKLKQPSPEVVQAAHEEAVSASRRRKRPRGKQSLYQSSRNSAALWDPDYCDELIRFFDRTSWEAMPTGAHGDMKAVIADKPPSLARFALHIGVTIPIIKLWLREIPAFAEAWETAQALEEAYFTETGAAGISATFAAAKLGLGKEKPVESAEETAPTEIIFSVAEPVGKIVTTNMGEVEE